MASGEISLGQSGTLIGKLVWSSTPDTTNNRSTITASIQLKKSSDTTQSTTGTWTGSVQIGASSVSGYKGESYSYYGSIGQSYVTVKTISTTLSHNDDGSLTVYFYGSGYAPSGTSMAGYSVKKDGYGIMDSITRATVPTLSASSVNMGSAVTINLPRASSSFTHKLKYAFGSLTNQTSGIGNSSSAGTSTTFTPPLTLANQIPSATSGRCTITCETYNGTTKIGTKTVSLTLNVPSSVVPTISSVSIAEATAGIDAKFAAYVQGKSTLAVNITAAGAYGSTISSYETYIQAVLYRGNSFTSGIVTASGTIGVVTTVTDSRGRTAQVSNSVTVLAYSPPEISALSAYRITTSGVASDEGNRIAMAMKFAISSVGGRNDHTYNFKYKKSTDANFTSFGSGSASWTYDSTQYFTSAPDISVDYAYVIRLEIADYFQTVAYEVQIPTAFTIMDFRNTGKGVAFGKVSEKDALEVAMNSEFTGYVKIFARGSDVADSSLIRMYRADGTLLAILATSDNGNGLNLHQYQNGAWASVIKILPNGTLAPKGVSMTDYVSESHVEEGIDVWNYKKFASGDCVLYGTFTVSITGSTGIGNMYYSEIKTISTPFGVANASISGNSGNLCQIVNSGGSYANKNISFRLLRPGTISGDQTVKLIVWGRWKEPL